MNFYLYQIRLQFILPFERLSVRDVCTDTQMQTRLRYLVIAHVANKLLENYAINCKKSFMNKINLKFRNSCFCSSKSKIDSIPFRFQKKGKFRLELVPGSGPWTTLISAHFYFFDRRGAKNTYVFMCLVGARIQSRVLNFLKWLVPVAIDNTKTLNILSR